MGQLKENIFYKDNLHTVPIGAVNTFAQSKYKTRGLLLPHKPLTKIHWPTPLNPLYQHSPQFSTPYIPPNEAVFVYQWSI